MKILNQHLNRRFGFLLFATLTLLLLIGCAAPVIQPTVILISFDGFRWDYMDKTDTPNLDQLVADGVKAESLKPIFPSKTFPNHYAIVTGLYAENHGLVANTMYDPEFDAWYRIGQGSSAVLEDRWYAGEPIWSTVEKQGQIAATMFWPGSEAKIAGYRPSYWYQYDGSIANESRIDQVLNWLDLPDDQRPTFISCYFSDTDTKGHEYGPDSPEVAQTIGMLDSLVGRLITGLRNRNLLDKVNVIFVSDHGMTQLSPDRLIYLDEILDPEDLTLVNWAPILDVYLTEDKVDSVYTLLANAHPQLDVYKKEDIPAHLHYNHHRRIAPIVGIAREGWATTTHQRAQRDAHIYEGGTHGYDPDAVKDMHGFFVAHGPAFRKGVLAPTFQNVQIYNIMATILGVEPAENDGALSVVQDVLK